MKSVYFILFLSLPCFNVAAQTDTAFIYMYGGIQNDACNQIRPTCDKGYIMIGTTNSFGCGNTSLYAVKIDSLCRHQWSKTYGGVQDQEGFAVVQTFDHGYAFVGFTNSYGAGGYDVYLVRADSLGNMLWQKTYGGSDWDFGYSVKQTKDSGFVICGQTYSYGQGNGDVYVIRTDKNGDTLWTKAIGGTGCDAGNSLSVRHDSLYMIAGYTTSFGIADTSALFVELNSGGKLVSLKTYGSNYTSTANSITPTIDNGYMIIGTIDSIYSGVQGELFLKTDSAGNCQWMSQLTNGDWNDAGKDAVEAPDTTYLSIGTSDGGGFGSSSVHLMHHTSTGFYLSGPSMGGAAAQFGSSVALGANGNVLFAGSSSSYGVGDFDIYLIRLKNDSMVQNYTLSITNFKDTGFCLLGISPQADIPIGVKVFPNPASTNATVLLQGQNGENYSVSLYDDKGQEVLNKIPFTSAAHSQFVTHLNTTNLPSGMYIYAIYSGAGRVGGGKLIVN